MTSDIEIMRIDQRLAALAAKGEVKNMRLINKWKRKRRAYLSKIEKKN